MRLKRLSLPIACSMRARLFVEQLGEEHRPLSGVGPVRDHRDDAPGATRCPVCLGVVAFVSQCRPRLDVRPDVERGWQLRAVADLASGQVEAERQAAEVGLEVDLAGEPAPRTAERLLVLPPFAPAADTCARTTVLSNICTRCAVGLISASAWKNASNTPDRLNRENRFHTLFQEPYSVGRARQVMLCTVKWCMARRNSRSSRPLSPLRDRQPRNTSSTTAQSRSVIPVSKSALTSTPTRYESPINDFGNPARNSNQSVHTA